MDFSIKAFDTKNTLAAAKSGCVAVAVFENKKLSEAAKALDLNGAVSAAVKSGDISGKPGSTLLLRGVPGVTAARVLLVGMGADEAISEKSFAGAVSAALKTFASAKTPTEFFQLQSDFARSAFDQLIAETSKNSETLLKVAGDVFQPISNRFAVAAEKFKAAA